MADEKITIDINADVSNVKDQLTQLKSDIDQGDGLLDRVTPSIAETLKPALEEARTQVSSLMKSLDVGQVSSSMLTGIKSSMGFITANVGNIKTIATELSSVFGNIPVEMGDNFNKTLSDMSRSAQQILNTTSASTRMFGAKTVSSLSAELQNHPSFSPAFKAAAKKYNLSAEQQSSLLNAVVRQATPAMYNRDHQIEAATASSGAIKVHGAIPDISDFRERLPARYNSIDNNLTPTSQSVINEKNTKSKMYEGDLTAAEYKKVKKLASENKTFERALVASGLARRTTDVLEVGKPGSGQTMPTAGILEMPQKPISRMQLAQAMGYMFSNELVPALEGAPAYYHPITSGKARDARSIANKNSTVPSEVYAAAEVLDSIDVDPVLSELPTQSVIAEAAKQKQTIALTSKVGKIKPNMYQVMSLTYDDFAKGKVIDTQGETQNLFDTAPRGTSVNKIISQSLYTDLIGMHGNLTNGSGGKENIAKPLMLQMDLSDRLFETDSTGAYVFEDGAPKQKQETRDLIAQMFKRSGEMKYTRNGKEETYHYPVRDYGKNGRYVPTNVKDGKIDLVEESAFLQASRPYLEAFGVNVFDNFMGEDSLPDGRDFRTLEEFSKTFEARNRLLTPGVPISSLGGKVPEMNKVAFVRMKDVLSRAESDAKADKTETGLDGAMFFMPGYIPGGDATVRAPSVKGVAETVDFKKMIRDLYGQDTKEFFVPAYSASDEMVRLYSAGGFDAIRNAVNETTGEPLYTQEDIDKNFVDIMKFDALVTDSVIKTPFAKGKSQDELRDWFGTSLDLSGGLRIVKTADEFWSEKGRLSNSVGQKLDMTPEELQANQDRWSSHIRKLEKDPNYIIKTLFSDDTEVLSKRIRENPGLIYSDPMAMDRVQSAIDSANLARMNNEVYANGMMMMGLALANPAEQILKFGELNGMSVQNQKLVDKLALRDVTDSKGNYVAGQIASAVAADRWTLKPDAPEDFAKLFNEKGIQGIREAKTSEGKKKYTKKDINKYLNQELDLAGLRYPNNQAEQFALHNAANYISLLDNYGLNRHGIYMNAGTIGKMGGGDFDGDTVQLLLDDLYEMSKRTYANRTSVLGADKGADRLKSPSEVWNRKSNPSDVADLLWRQSVASFSMGAVSNANDALTQIDWNDPDFIKRYGAAAYDLKAMYDIDSTFAKSGVKAEWTAAATRARSLGKPFVSLFKGLQGIAEDPSAESYAKMGNFAEVNFPSIYNGLTVSMLSTLAKHPVSSGAVDEMIRAQEAIQGISGKVNRKDKVALNRKNFLQINNKAMAGLLTRGAIPSDTTVAELESAHALWGSALNSKYGKDILQARGDSLTEEQQAAVKEWRNQANRIAHLKQFGISQESIRLEKGYAGEGFLKGNPLLEDQTEFQEMFDKKQASQQIGMALTTGGSPLAEKAVKDTVAKKTPAKQDQIAIAAAQQKYKNMTFSKSMLDSFMESPDKWYKRYVERDKSSDDNVYNLFGKKVHNVLDMWAKDRMETGATRSADEYEKELVAQLGGEDIRGKLYDSNGNILPNHKERMDKAVAFVRSLPELFKDEKILGIESTVAPSFGEGRKSIGFIDLVTQAANGDIIHTDLKPNIENGGVMDQLNLYNPKGFVPAYDPTSGNFTGYMQQPNAGRPAKYGRVLSYGNAPGRNVRMFEYNEDAIRASEEKYQGYADRVEAYANRGFDSNEITFGTWNRLPDGNVPTNIVSEMNQAMLPKPGSLVQSVVETANVMKNLENSAKAAPTISHTPGLPPPDPTEGYTNEEARDFRERDEEARALIDGNTGRGIAKGMALQQEINDYFDELSNITGSLRSVGRKKENPQSSSQWNAYRYKLDAGYYAKMQTLTGATDEDRAKLSNQHDAAVAAFNDALRISSVKDVESLNESLQKKIAGEEVDPGTEKAVKDFDELANSIERATDAYNVYKEELSKKVENVDETKAAIKADQEEIKRLAQRNAEIETRREEIGAEIRRKGLTDDQKQSLRDERENLKEEQKKNRTSIDTLKDRRSQYGLTDEEVQALDESENLQSEMKELAEKRREQIKNRSRKTVEHDYTSLKHLAEGTDYTPEELAEMKKLNLQDEIDKKRANIARLVERKLLTEEEGSKYTEQLDSIDVDAYANKIRGGAQFQKDQEEKAYNYKQRKLARDRDDEIMTTRERNEARREGKPVDKSKHEERVYEARIAELEEQRRVLNDKVWDTSDTVTQQEKDRALKQRQKLDTYIADVKANHDETLRTDAFADVRDFNERLTKENSEHGADSIAVTYAQQFQNLNQQIEEATASYEKLKAKIDSGSYTKKDKEAFGEADAEVKKLQESANEKRDRLAEQFKNESDDKLGNLQHLATGEDYTPAEIAKLRKTSLQKQIEQFVKGQNFIAGNNELPESVREAAKVRAEQANAIDLDAYEKNIAEQEQLKLDQKTKQEELRTQRLYRNAKKHARDPFGRNRSWRSSISANRDNTVDQLNNDIALMEEDILKKKQKLSQTPEGTEEYKKLSSALTEAEKNLGSTKKAASTLSGPFGAAAAAASALAQSVGNLAVRFGKNLFQKAWQEAKQFVKEWNASMTEIQMVTGKTGTEIDKLSESLVDTAVNLRVDPTDVSATAVDLYRQGLDDDEVSERMEDVIKFSKVANISVEEANKMLTTAVSNGLVDSTEEAMDAMVALGDSAATTASEISKGMQKSAAAAKEAGVSYEQLLTMLTIVTSKTQLGGSNAGSAMQMMFSRLYKIGSGEEVYDENHNRIFESDMTKALSKFGVDIFDEEGNFRGAYDIVMELAQNWDEGSDTDQQAVLDTLGAGRQSSNIATLLQGLAEDDGELASKYMDLATNSGGITNTKYEAYYDSMQAAIDNVKASFDQLVESLSADGTAIGFINFIAEIIQGLTALTEAVDAASVAVVVLGATLLGFAVGASPVGAVVGALISLGTLGGIGNWLYKEDEPVDGMGNLKDDNEKTFEHAADTDSFLDRLDELNNKENRTTEETAELEAGLAKLATQFGITVSAAAVAAGAFDEISAAIAQAREEAAKYTVQELRFNLVSNADDIFNQTALETVNLRDSKEKNTKKFLNKNNGKELSLEDVYDIGSELSDNVVEYMLKDAGFSGLMEMFGFVDYGISTTEDFKKIFTDGLERSDFFNDKRVQQRLTSFKDADGNLMYYDKNNELNENLVIQDMGKAFVQYMAEHYSDYEADTTEDNQQAWTDMLTDILIESLAGNTSLDEKQIREIATVKASELASGIMAAGSYSDQLKAGREAIDEATDFVFEGYDGYQESLDTYVEETAKTWSVEKKDGTVVTGLTKTEAENVNAVEYGTRYVLTNIGGEKLGMFESEEDAEQYQQNQVDLYKNRAENGWGTKYATFFDDKGNLITGENGTINIIEKLKEGFSEYSGEYMGTDSELTALWTELAKKGGWHPITGKTWSDAEVYEKLANGDFSEEDVIQALKNINQEEIKETNETRYKYAQSGVQQVIIDNYDKTHIENTGLLEEEERAAQEAAIRNSTKFLTNVDDIIDSYKTSESNSGKYAVDQAFEEMMEAGVTSFHELGEAIDEGLIGHIDQAIQTIPELGVELDKLIERDADGNWVGVKAGVDADAAFSKFLTLLAGGSLSYTDAVSINQTNKATLGLNAWKSVMNGQAMSEVANLDYLKEILGADLYAEIAQRSNSIQGSNVVQRSSKVGTATDVRQVNADGEYNYYNVDANEEARSFLLSGIDQDTMDVANMLLQNYLYGIEGLTANQSLELQGRLMNAFANGSVSSLNETLMSYYTNGNTDMSLLWGASKALEAEGLNFSNLEEGVDGYEQAEEILNQLGLTSSKVKKMLSDLNKTMSSEAVRAANLFGKATEKVASKMDTIASSDYADNIRNANSALLQLSNNKYYRNQWRGGNTKSEIKSQIASQIGVDETAVDQWSKETLDEMLNAVEQQDIDNYITELEAEMNNLLADEDLKVKLPSIIAENGADMAGLIAALDALGIDATNLITTCLKSLSEMNGSVTFETFSENGTLGIRVKDFKAPKGIKSGGGGGGGGGGSSKTAGAKLIEELDRENKLTDHKIKMIQYEETRYQNAGELSNYGIMLQHEVDAQKDYASKLENNIERMKQQLAATEKGSDEWYELRDAILSAEEALSETNNTIADTTKKIEENNQAILKTRTDLEQTVKDEIENRINEERDQLDGQASMQQTILDIIKNRYEEEWELMQKDIDKKKKALQEEIDLIDERLQRRKDAEDEAEKYEELAEYKRQLALISTDSTRTKDQASLREKIAELEKELAWDEAEEEADLQKEGLQDQIDAYDEYVDDYQEYLDDLLENANNFADEVNEVMKMSHEDMIGWLKTNSEEYANSFGAIQKQMSQGWTDTFKQMKGIVDTFWEEITQHLSSKDSFIEYMKQSSSYQNASDSEKEQMIYNWGTMYDSWTNALKVSDDAKDYKHDDPGDGDDDGSGGGGTPKTETLKFGFKATYGTPYQSKKQWNTRGKARSAGEQWVENKGNADILPSMPEAAKQQIRDKIAKAKAAVTVFKTGGIVDYTGPAWVDGTKSRPEAFLSAEDTRMIRTLIDGWKYVATRPTITSIDGLLKDGSSGNTIGDVYVTLNEAQFNTDDDYELVAQKVGEAFTKELAKNGFSTASYSF